MSAFGANLAVAAAVVLSAVSLLLLAVGGLSYWRLRHRSLLWIGLAFAVMTGQGVYLTILTVQERAAIAAGDQSLPVLTVVNLGIVVALYLAVFRR